MKRLLTTSLIAAGLLATAGSVLAQPAGIFRPTLSPYLNLNRGGNAGINYYGLVRPQIQTNQALQSLQQQIYNQGGIGGQFGQEEGDTGVVGGYQTQWGYFQNVPLQPANLQIAGYGVGGGLNNAGGGLAGGPLGGGGIGIGFIAGGGGGRAAAVIRPSGGGRRR